MFGVIILLKDEILTNQPQIRTNSMTLNYGLVSRYRLKVEVTPYFDILRYMKKEHLAHG